MIVSWDRGPGGRRLNANNKTQIIMYAIIESIKKRSRERPLFLCNMDPKLETVFHSADTDLHLDHLFDRDIRVGRLCFLDKRGIDIENAAFHNIFG